MSLKILTLAQNAGKASAPLFDAYLPKKGQNRFVLHWFCRHVKELVVFICFCTLFISCWMTYLLTFLHCCLDIVYCQQILECSRMKFSEIPTRLGPLLMPPDPIVINHVIMLVTPVLYSCCFCNMSDKIFTFCELFNVYYIEL